MRLRPCLILLHTLILSGVAASCIPVKGAFLRPAAPGGRLTGAMCPPLNSYLLLNVDGVTVSAHARDLGREQVMVRLGFEVPAGSVVRLVDPRVGILEEGDEGPFAEGALEGRVWVSLGRTGDFPADSAMVGSRVRRWARPGPSYVGTTGNAYFWFEADLPHPGTDPFVVRPPPILVNDVERSIPDVSFTKDSSWFLLTMNC